MLNKDNMTSRGKNSGNPLKQSASTYGEDKGLLAHEACFSLPIAGWHPLLDAAVQKEASAAIENGKVLVLPHLPFTLTREESSFLRSDCVAPRAKVIRFSLEKQHLWGVADKEKNPLALEALMKRYAETASDLVTRLFPGYVPQMITGNTSFSPLEVRRHPQGARHDDSLLHVSAFSSRPNGGKRLLRVFTNIHPADQPRVWRVGEPFENLIARFLPHLSSPVPGSAFLRRILGMTKQRRTPYDHFMLQLRDIMKHDTWYQGECPQATLSFPAGSSWIVFSDQVPHATLAGQHVLAQTFVVPPEALDDPDTSPLRIMEKIMHRKLA